MTLSFFNDDYNHNDVNIDIEIFSQVLSEYAGSFDEKRMVSKMKQILRDEELLQDFLQRLNISMPYLIELSYAFSPKIITPQLVKELSKNVSENRNFPFESNKQ